jgi:hypothetical protein
LEASCLEVLRKKPRAVVSGSTDSVNVQRLFEERSTPVLVLFETPAGYALFKCKDKEKLTNFEDIYIESETAEKANSMMELQAFHQYKDTTEALAGATATIESTLDKGLTTFLEKSITEGTDEVQHILYSFSV